MTEHQLELFRKACMATDRQERIQRSTDFLKSYGITLPDEVMNIFGEESYLSKHENTDLKVQLNIND